MSGDKKRKFYSPTISELVLAAVLVLLIAMTRIYYGPGQTPMVVWKGEITFHDTLVNLPEVTTMPQDQLLQAHKSVFYQLEDMDLIEADNTPPARIPAQPHSTR